MLQQILLSHVTVTLLEHFSIADRKARKRCTEKCQAVAVASELRLLDMCNENNGIKRKHLSESVCTPEEAQILAATLK